MHKLICILILCLFSNLFVYSQTVRDTLLNRRHVHIYYKYDSKYFVKDELGCFEFRKGLLTGKYYAYGPKLYRDTILYVEIIDGLKNGVYKRFDQKGRVLELANYVNDSLNGIRNIYLYDKKKVYENVFRYTNGKLSEEIKKEF